MHADERGFDALSAFICVHLPSIRFAVQPPIRTFGSAIFVVDRRDFFCLADEAGILFSVPQARMPLGDLSVLRAKCGRDACMDVCNSSGCRSRCRRRFSVGKQPTNIKYNRQSRRPHQSGLGFRREWTEFAQQTPDC
jgi:hypothetical protein